MFAYVRSSAKCLLRIISFNLPLLMNDRATKVKGPHQHRVSSVPCVGVHGLEGNWLSELLEQLLSLNVSFPSTVHLSGISQDFC